MLMQRMNRKKERAKRQRSAEEEKNSDAPEAQAGQRREGGGTTKAFSAAVATENIRGWNSQFPGTAAFMHSQELKTLILCRHHRYLESA